MQKEEICSILKKFMKGFPEEFSEGDMYPSFINNLPTTFYTGWNSGATKCVLYNNKWDFVIKVPLTGQFYCDDYEDDNGCLHCDEYYEEFCGANDLPMMSSENSCWDYCNAEAVVYNFAEEEGFAEFFAKTEFVGFLYGHPIYVQEKVKVFECDKVNPKYKDMTKDVSDSLNCHFLNSYWLIDALNYYGYEKTIKLIEFLNKNHLSHDLHTDNIGYIGGRPVLLDYVGWRS